MGKIIADWQCRAGRSAVNMTAQALANAAELSRRTVEDFERGKPIKLASVERISEALERAGVYFDEKGCVCRRAEHSSDTVATVPNADSNTESDGRN
jgi:transcriptional regulator with XRE-family HTH domain